jgi:cytidylate kinase
MIITIDGPVASGKSTVAKELGNRLGLFYLNTGLLYRAVAYILVHELRKKINWELPFEPKEEELIFISDIKYEFVDKEPHLFFKDKDITEFLSNASYDQVASVVSASKLVRDRLLPVQRDIGKKYNIVADGRDCGSVVFPNADFKFFLTANIDSRVRRVLSDPKRKVEDQDYSRVAQELQSRDKRDEERAVAPLVVPNDAIFIDSSTFDFEQTVQTFLGYIKK